MQANQPQGGDAKASTATSATRTRPAMASKRLDLPSTCDICGNARDALQYAYLGAPGCGGAERFTTR